MTGELIHDLLDRTAEATPDRIAVRAGDDGWTFAELATWSRHVARRLADAGVGPGQRVAVMTANRVEFVVVVNAISRLGAATVLLSPAWKAAEVRHALELTGATRAVGDADSIDTLRSIPALVSVLDVADLAATASDASDVADAEAAEAAHRADPGDEAVLVFSSGTTGMPKAVRHTHESMRHAVRHWVAALGLGPEDRFQVATPPSHILGLLNLLCAADAGAAVRLHRRFDLDAVLDCIESDRITIEMAVAPIALAMANHPRLEDHDLSSLRYIMWGATPVNAAVAETVTARSGVRWLAAYGASEVPVIACNPVQRPDEWRLDSVGPPPDGVELRVVDLVDGTEVPAGATGEIQVRSPSVMAGYLPAEATATVMDGDWYRTGDVGHLDDRGWVHVTDRSKEMIKVKGFQVAPAEIEGVLHSHPAVLDCAVFGVAHEEAGEVPVAAVRLDPDAPVAAGELAELVAGSLAAYKRLHDVIEVEEIPRLPSGKVLRRELRARFG